MHGSFGKNIADKPALYSARDYDGLRTLINARRIELRMKLLDLDHDARLQNGYAAKLVCGMRNFGPLTLGPILDALGVDIVLIPRSVGGHRLFFVVISFFRKFRWSILTKFWPPQFEPRGYRSTVRNRVCLIKLKPHLIVGKF
jgi:hypothetical protein